MSNTRQYQAQFLGPFSTVETFHQGGGTAPGFGQFPAFPNAGELGSRVIVTQAGVGSKEYQLCQIDSGATAATPSGAIAQGQILYWKNRAQYLVTNDNRFADTVLNGTAGILGTAGGVSGAAGVLVTPTTGSSPAVPGDAVYLQTKGQCSVLLVGTGGPGVTGDTIVPFASSTVPRAGVVALASTPAGAPIGRVLSGVTGGGATGTLGNADMQFPEIP